VILAVAAMLVATLTLPGTALALPSEIPDETPMVDWRVRAIEQVGNYFWWGTSLPKSSSATVRSWPTSQTLANVSNVAVFDSVTDQYVEVAPKLGAARVLRSGTWHSTAIQPTF
jgi:hypothetical protein